MNLLLLTPNYSHIRSVPAADAEAFNREWQERTRQSMQSIGYDGGHRNPRHRAIGHGGNS